MENSSFDEDECDRNVTTSDHDMHRWGRLAIGADVTFVALLGIVGNAVIIVMFLRCSLLIFLLHSLLQ